MLGVVGLGVGWGCELEPFEFLIVCLVALLLVLLLGLCACTIPVWAEGVFYFHWDRRVTLAFFMRLVRF